MPFIEPHEWKAAVMHCTSLVAVNLLYFVRAMTEERQLMNDPAYRAYAEWIGRNEVVARMTKIFG